MTACFVKRPMPVGEIGTLYLVEGWRARICKCKECVNMYVDQNVLFLPDMDDTVQTYEERGKAMGVDTNSATGYDTGMEALSQLDRVSQLEAIQGYNDMKYQLMEYLKKFKDNKKVVRPEDIREFFDGMAAQKKRRTDPPHFCH